MTSAGDVNGDGYDDVLVGALWYDNGQMDEGRVWLYHGSPSGLGSSNWTADSDQAGANYGAALAGIGDINGDGFGDVAVGAPRYDNGHLDEGRVWIYHGSSTGLSQSNWSADSDQANALYGASMAGAGDVNGDGYDDVLVGAPRYSSGQSEEGRVWLYLGSPLGLITVAAWRGESDQPGAWYGSSVAGAGDVNGDGFSDVLVGVPRFDNTHLDEGQALLFFGSPETGTSYCSVIANSTDAPALIRALHSPSIAAGNLVLEVQSVPNTPGIFFHGGTQTQVPFGNGFLCTGGGQLRGAAVQGAGNEAKYIYDNSDVDHSLAGFAGTTRHFQYWFRDPEAGPGAINTSDAVSVALYP